MIGRKPQHKSAVAAASNTVTTPLRHRYNTVTRLLCGRTERPNANLFLEKLFQLIHVMFYSAPAHLSKLKRYSNAPGSVGLLGRVYSPLHSIARHKNCWCTGNVLIFRAFNENCSKKMHKVF